MQEDHQLCLGMMAGLAFWVRHLVGLMEDIVLRDAAGRLARYLLNSPTAADGAIELPTLKRHVASHLNLTSETFSRTSPPADRRRHDRRVRRQSRAALGSQAVGGDCRRAADGGGVTASVT